MDFKMPHLSSDTRALSDAQIRDFISNGFVKIAQAFPKALAEDARRILWRDLGLDPHRPKSWTRPVVRLGMYVDKPFVAAANSPALIAAYDQLAGAGRWVAPGAIGTFPVRFPSRDSPGDDGWHVDMSFGWDKSDFLDWRANIFSKGRALLMLFLFSDVSKADAPTRLRKGSHRDVARMLAPAGDAGLTLREIVARLPETDHCEESIATGEAGTVYLCHPFLVHAAQAHRGSNPRFLAQPPLLPRDDLKLERGDSYYSPVEIAIREALGMFRRSQLHDASRLMDRHGKPRP